MGAFDIPVIYGLALGNNLSDLTDKDNALRTLGLEPTDLASIGNINEYLTRDSFQCISNLDEPIQRKLSRYYTDTLKHNDVLDSGNDITNITGNVTLNGPIASSSIRYFSLDSYDASRDLFIPIDISTSRASSWSGFGDNLNYGAELLITNGSKLSAAALKFNTSSEPRVFESSEKATHIIKTNINGKEYYLFAMKDVPLVFNGVFRNYTIRVGVNNTGTKVSSRVYLTDSKKEMRLFRDLQYTNNTATIAGTTINTRPRTIEIYCDPTTLTTLSIPRLGLTNLPITKIPSLKTLDISTNNIQEIPNIAEFAPGLLSLDISNNGLFKSNDFNLRTFSEKFVLKLPRVNILIAGNTTGGRIQTIAELDGPYSVIEKYLPLTRLDLNRSYGQFFTGVAPSVSATCITYDIRNNNFSELPARGLFRPKADNKITRLYFSGNYNLSLTPGTSAAYLDGENYSDDLEEFEAYTALLPIPDLAGKQKLKSFGLESNTRSYIRNIGSVRPLSGINSSFSLVTDLGNYKFQNCDSLKTITLRWCPIVGKLPIFTNPNLTDIRIHYSNLSGAVKPGSATTDYSIYKSTFDTCRKTLQVLSIWNVIFGDQLPSVGSDYFTRPIEEGAFDNMPELYDMHYVTSSRTQGNTPSFAGCSKLKTIQMHENQFSGLTTISNSCKNTLETIRYSYNQLMSGGSTKTVNGVPGVLSISRLFEGEESIFKKVTYIDLESNQFNGLVEIDKVPQLKRLNVSKNRLTGAIPDFSNVPSLQYLILNDNRFTSFTPNGFDKLTNIREINLLNNKDDLGNKTLLLSQVELIINSLYYMYTINSKYNNRGVKIYLSNLDDPYIITTSTTIEQINLMEKRGAYDFVGIVKQTS